MALLVAGAMVLGQMIVVDNDPVVLAAEAGVETQALLEAMAATGLGAQEYLEMSGELAPPAAVIPTAARAPTATIPGVWLRLADCESGSGGRPGTADWHVDAYHDGGLQFLPATWTAYGGGKYARYAHQATPAQQVEIAQKLQAAAGWGQWPTCARRLGLR